MPSFIHTSRQSVGDTTSPYQWWVISCWITGAERA